MKANDLRFSPVILGADENAYACARLFFERYGVISNVLCSAPLTATSNSRILKRTVIPDLDADAVFERDVPEILSRLKEKHGRLLLIPCSDYYSELCIKFKSKIEKLIENPFISSETYSMFSDKAAFAQLARSMGISHPETIVSKASSFSSDTLPFDFPLVIKPSNSNSSEYLRADIKDKKKVYICRTKSELDASLENLSVCGLSQSIIIQRYISGSTDCLFTVNAYCDKNSQVRLIGASQALLDCRDPLSIGNYLALRPIKDRVLCDKCACILEKLNYRGFANFDIKKDPKTGDYYFLELNPRQGRSSYYIHTAGEDLMREMVDDIIFEKPFTERKYAEENGIWSALPLCFIQKSLPHELYKTKNFDYALDFKHDRSLLRQLKLAKRNYTVAKKNQLTV